VTFAGDQIPMTPLARSFLTGPQVDLHGQLKAKASVKGAGITGRSLREHLAADFDFSASGLDYQVTAVRSPIMKTLIGVLGTVLKLPKLEQSPIDSMSLKAVVAKGLVTLNEYRISSPAFVANLKGTAQLADVFTNSAIRLPVSLAITAEGKSVKVPDFLTIAGTVGKPKSEIDPVGLAQVATQLPWGIGSVVSTGLSKVGEALEKATGGLLSNLGNTPAGAKGAASAPGEPGKSAAPPSVSTNVPAKTNKLQGLLEGLQNAIGGRPATNGLATTNKPAGTNKPASTNKPPVKAPQPAPAPKK
jgi:hypothetical protein